MATKILVIEDDKGIADSVAYTLRQEGFETHTAYDGPTGLAEALSLKPDLVILDLLLPGMDGFDVFRALRTLGRRGHRFEVVFLDPPYGMGLVGRTLEVLATSGLLAPGAAVVAESSVREAVQVPAGYEVVRDRRYGDTRVQILIWRGT